MLQTHHGQYRKVPADMAKIPILNDQFVTYQSMFKALIVAILIFLFLVAPYAALPCPSVRVLFQGSSGLHGRTLKIMELFVIFYVRIEVNSIKLYHEFLQLHSFRLNKLKL